MGEQLAQNKIKLTAPQAAFFTSTQRYVAFCGGFGSGKSQALFVKMLYDKITFADTNLLYCAPTYSLIRDIAHERICAMLDLTKIKYILNRSEQVLEINGYGKILFRTLDNPERLVGFEVFRIYIDELDTLRFDQAQLSWQKLLGRCRQKSVSDPTAANQIFVATTPEGFRFVYNRWVKNTTPEYKLIKAPTASNPHLPAGYIDSLKSSYPSELIAAYLDGEFVNLTSKTVYSSFSRKLNDSNERFKPSDILHIGMDFNVLNMNAVIHITNNSNNSVHAVAEITGIENTMTMINYMESIFPDHFPNRIIIYPDAYGNSKRTASSETDHALIRAAGLTIDAPNGNPPIRDRVASMNHMFADGNGNRRYFVNTELCPQYTVALEQQPYDQNGMPLKDRNNNYDDINDAAGYFISRKYPIIREVFQCVSVRSY